MREAISRSAVLAIIGVFATGCTPSLDSAIATLEKAVEAAGSAQETMAAIYTADLEEINAAIAMHERRSCGDEEEAWDAQQRLQIGNSSAGSTR